MALQARCVHAVRIARRTCRTNACTVKATGGPKDSSPFAAVKQGVMSSVAVITFASSVAVRRALASDAGDELGPGEIQQAWGGEQDVINNGPPSGYIVDDGAILSRASKSDINKELNRLEQKTGYHVYVVTVRKLSGSDPFTFADQVIESWYPSAEQGDNKGLLVLAKQSKEGALVGGPSFQKNVGDELVDSIVSEQVPYLAGQEKYNEATVTSIERVAAKLEGREVPEAPGAEAQRTGKKRSSFKTREETEQKRGIYSKIVIGLLILSVVAPFIQYFGYVRR